MGSRSHQLNRSGGNRFLSRSLIELVLIVLALSALSPKTMIGAEPYGSRSNTQQDEQDWEDEQTWEEDQQQLEREGRARQERARQEQERQERERQEWDSFKAEQNVIVLHRTMDGQQGGTVSLITLAAPKEAKKAYENAGKELSKEKPNLSKATQELEKAVEIYPVFAVAWFMLGEIRVAQNDRSGATEAFQLAIAADPDYSSPRASLALIALEEERWEDAAQLADDALEISPSHIKAHYFRAMANSRLGRIEVAEASALRVQDSNEVQNYPLVHYVLGWVIRLPGPTGRKLYRGPGPQGNAGSLLYRRHFHQPPGWGRDEPPSGHGRTLCLAKVFERHGDPGEIVHYRNQRQGLDSTNWA